MTPPARLSRGGRSSGGAGWKPREQMPNLLPPPAAFAGSPQGEQLLGTKGANYVAKLSPGCNWPAAADANEGLVQDTQMSPLQSPPPGNAFSALQLHLTRKTQGCGGEPERQDWILKQFCRIIFYPCCLFVCFLT